MKRKHALANVVALPKRGRGRPRRQPDPEGCRQVETMSGLGLTQIQIAQIIGISVDTLQRNFPDAITLGKAKATLQVAQSLYKRAISGDNQAALFYLRCQAGWMDRQGLQLTGPGNGPLQLEALRIEVVHPPNRKPG